MDFKNECWENRFFRHFKKKGVLSMRIGIDLGGSHIGVGLVDEDGTLVEKIQKDIWHKQEKKIQQEIEETVVQYIKQILENQAIGMEQIKSIGIASPGTVVDGVIVIADNLGIENFPIVEKIKKEFDVPVFLKNDAKCAAMAEKHYGSLKPYSNSLFLTIGTGIGGAVIWKNELLVPHEFPGFEVGHMVIEKQGKQCKCGKKGCFETYASMVALKKKIIEIFSLDVQATGVELLEFIHENRGNKQLEEILNTYLEDLAIGISNLVNIFEPEAISLGGSFVYYKEIFLDRLEEKLKRNHLLFNKKVPTIVVAMMKNDAGIIGASRIKE